MVGLDQVGWGWASQDGWSGGWVRPGGWVGLGLVVVLGWVRSGWVGLGGRVTSGQVVGWLGQVGSGGGVGVDKLKFQVS